MLTGSALELPQPSALALGWYSLHINGMGRRTGVIDLETTPPGSHNSPIPPFFRLSPAFGGALACASTLAAGPQASLS